MFDPTSTSAQNLKNTYSIVKSSRRQPEKISTLVSEEVAIVTCSLLIAVFAMLMMIIMQTIYAVVWGTVTIWQLVNGEGLFTDGDEL